MLRIKKQSDDAPQYSFKFNEAELIGQALKYLKEAKPDVDTKKPEFYGVQYRFTHERDGYFETKTGGKTVFVKARDVQETIEVTFKLLATEEKWIENKRNCARYDSFVVSFPRPGVAAHVNDGSLTLYGDFVK